jgi:quercetin dioxygenase-like cupin family protein
LSWKTNDPASDAVLEAAAVDAVEGRSFRDASDPAYLEGRVSFDTAMLGLGLAAARPAPATLRARVLAGLPADGGRDAVSYPRPGVTLVPSTVSEWKEGPSPGVQFKDIHRDETRRSHSFLLRMEPGSRYPDHSHSFVEEIFVIEGSLSAAGQLLRAGDYCRSEPGTADHDVFSAEGALFLVSLSEKQKRGRDAAV